MRSKNSPPIIALLTLLVCASAGADDWPQFQGPKRDGVWREAGLLDRIPDAGLKIRFRAPVRLGYSGPAVATGRVYVTGFAPDPDAPKTADAFRRITQQGTERVCCFDAITGKSVWTAEQKVAYTMSYAGGPRATPLVDGDRVYALGGEGHLRCLDAATGQQLWARAMASDASPTPMWGFACQLLIDGDRLICQGGGNDPAKRRGLVTALDKRTGEVRWSALSGEEPGYAPPMLYTIGGVRQLIVWHPAALAGLDPESGKALWSLDLGPARMGLTIPTPLLVDDAKLGQVLFLTTFYEGSALIGFADGPTRPKILWRKGGKARNTEALHTLFASPVEREGCVYGVCANGELRCISLRTGDRLWETTAATTYDAGPTKWSNAFLIRLGEAGGRYLLANEHGDLHLADLDPQGYHPRGHAHVLDPTNTDAHRPVVWVPPAAANGCVYWRNDKELVCVEFTAPAR